MTDEELPFADRCAAGERLAKRLGERATAVDLVLAVPRGGVAVAKPVAEALGAQLDVTVPRKIGAPHNREFAVAAICADGELVTHPKSETLNLPAGYLDRMREATLVEVAQRLAFYRGVPRERDVTSRRVLIVDDGVATGLTLEAAVRSCRKRGAAWVGVAVPVGPKETYARFVRLCDDACFLHTPSPFFAVGEFYRDFHQIDDEEVKSLLGTRAGSAVEEG